MKRTTAHARSRRRARTAGLAAVAVLGTLVLAPGPASAREPSQPELSSRDVPVIEVDGLRFRDLDRNGSLTPYEDWRRTAAQRARDLVGRMSLEQKAGLMVHGSLTSSGQGYDMAKASRLVKDRHLTSVITRLSAKPGAMATANNAVQQIAEKQPLGIPVVVSTDPRNGFSVTEGQTVAGSGTTAMPDTTGMAATGNPRLTRELADIVRREYRAMGISEGLSPQADIATEPRWTRINGTFGSDPDTARRQVKAYVAGLQNGTGGLGTGSVATVTKHWAGYGAQDNGYDSHYYYGRYATFPGNNFAAHLTPFQGAFAAGTSGVMPTYSILKNLVHRGHKLDQTGAGYNSYLLKDLLRGTYGFDGVIVSDWGITNDCPRACKENKPPNSFIGPWGAAMPWGMEDASVLERTAATVNAGVDQIGGSDDPAPVIEAVKKKMLSEPRIDASARRVLEQTFRLGLFENPYADPERAADVVGNRAFQATGDRAQAASLTLLTDEDRTLPARRSKTHSVYLHGIAAKAAEKRGLKVVDDPAEADLAVVRLADPRGGSDLTGLDFTGNEKDYRALKAAKASGVPTVAVPKLDRPLILTGVAEQADAVLANYGVSDEVLLQTVFGERRPGGRLPFELPSSAAAVEAQLGDVPDDSEDPLFDRGSGLRYR